MKSALDVSSIPKDFREKLREQEAMLGFAHIIVRDMAGRITFWSETDAEIYGWTAEDAIGEAGDALLNTSLPEARAVLEARAVADGRWEGEIIHHDRSGRQHVLMTTWAPHYNEEGTLTAFIEVNCDISKQKAVELELRNRERDFRTFFELAGVGNVIANVTTGNFVTVNQTFCELTGYDEEELLSLSSEQLTHPEDRARDEMGWRDALRNGDAHYTIEKRYVRKDGTPIWVSVTSTVIRDTDGTAVYAAGVIVDVSTRHEALREIADARRDLERRVLERTAALAVVNAELDQISRKFATLIDASPLAIIALNHGHEVEIWNPGAESLFGVREKEAKGKRLVDLPIGWDSPDALAAVLRATADGHANLNARTSHGRKLDVGIWSAPYPGLGDAAGGHVLLLLDETEKKFLEHALLEAGEREQRRIGQALQDGLAQHLLGATFAAQALFKELERGGSPSAPRAGDLARLLNDSVLEARNLARGINPIEVDPAGLMSALQELAERTPGDAHVELRCDRPVLVHNTETALNVFRIAQDAVADAIRHTHATRILIRLSEDHGFVTLQVSGNGRSDPLAYEDGIGLGIMKYRAQAINGELIIETPADSGTTVTCTFTSHA